ncbi:MAG TPA: nucleotidyl transferase AbiEii/AbiGii toxin family protein, partial [Acidobacteriota bacterium]|nr:nucleotidyl transferase AbiEii/AbiGii toxin family protein [Acidobacteriota bacterium]
MHEEILTKEQHDLLPLVGKFRERFGLVGGTAIALHIGHRESIDFDMFSPEEFQNRSVRDVFRRAGKEITVLRALTGQFTFVVDGVYMTFFHFPYPITYSESFGKAARMPTLLTLAAMKAFALGQRSKWKDYVDLYFILRDFHSLEEVARQAETLFGSEFNAKLFRQQLSFFDDVSYK